MPTPDEARIKTRTTYNAASDTYDDPANTFWSRFGRRTIKQLNIRPGSHVLDVCSGSGASAIPAAEVVGPNGAVIGIDLADDLLKLARAKADAQGLKNIEFRYCDMLETGFPNATFDTVVCVFGIFFVPDMTAAVRELWRLVRPNGTLAITTWGPRFFEPGSAVFWNLIREVRPDLYKGFNPWDRLCEPEALRELLIEGGADHVAVHAESGFHQVPTPQAWWSGVMGSGYRGTVDQLSAEDLERVRSSNLTYIRESGIHQVEANVVYGVATKFSL